MIPANGKNTADAHLRMSTVLNYTRKQRTLHSTPNGNIMSIWKNTTH